MGPKKDLVPICDSRSSKWLGIYVCCCAQGCICVHIVANEALKDTENTFTPHRPKPWVDSAKEDASAHWQDTRQSGPVSAHR